MVTGGSKLILFSMLQLVLFRVVQGLGAGAVMPFPLIIAGDLYSVAQRGKIQALFSAMWGISAVLAPAVGALVTEYADWRWIFFINIPICLIALVLLQAYREEYHPKRAKIDALGSLLFAAGVSLLLLAISVQANQAFYAVTGLAVLFIFLWYEKRHPSPIVPLNMLKRRSIAWMIVNSFLTCAALFGTSSYIPYFLQEEGYALFASGIPLFAMAAGWMISAVPAGSVVLRWGYRLPLIIGNSLLAGSGILLFLLGKGSGAAYVSIVMLVQGIAFGLIFTVSTIGSQQLVEPYEKGISTSLQLFSRNIGTAVGVTIMGALLHGAVDFYVGIHDLFTYGLLASLSALGCVWFIRVSASNSYGDRPLTLQPERDTTL